MGTRIRALLPGLLVLGACSPNEPLSGTDLRRPLDTAVLRSDPLTTRPTTLSREALAKAAAAAEGSTAPGDATSGSEAWDPDRAPLARSTVRLLPFRIRLERIARLLGTNAGNAIFEPLRTRRVELGDYDYGANLAPDPAWLGERIVAWQSALEPVCGSETFRSRFPAVATDPGEFIALAYGRKATPTEVDELRALAASASTPRARSTAACMAILSSLEFIAR